MNDTAKKKDPWRFAALGLWELFFFIGLLPDPAFRLLRELGGVLPQRAVVNSSFMLTVALAGFFAAFAYNQCRNADLSPGEAADKMLQYAVVGLIAFLPVDFLGVIGVIANQLIQNKSTIYISAAAKILAWLYLLAVITKYYLGNDRAFAAMPSLFPSGRTSGRTSGCKDSAGQGPAPASTSDDAPPPRA